LSYHGSLVPRVSTQVVADSIARTDTVGAREPIGVVVPQLLTVIRSLHDAFSTSPRGTYYRFNNRIYMRSYRTYQKAIGTTSTGFTMNCLGTPALTNAPQHLTQATSQLQNEGSALSQLHFQLRAPPGKTAACHQSLQYQLRDSH